MTTVTLGLDGGSFELIDPWLTDGDLPNLECIRRGGLAVDMQSCLPPVTCPNWQCYATGMNPGKLGVFWWEAIDREVGEIRDTSNREDFDGDPFWTHLDGEVAVVNFPTSYPPPSINGVHIAGGPGAQQTGFTNPLSLESVLRERYDYQVHPEKMALLSKDDPASPCIDEIYRLIDQRFDVLLDFLESDDYEFIHLTVFYLNVLHHFYWDHAVVKRAWEQIDDRIGDILAADELDTLFVISDHGANEIRTEFRINTWLEREGYLHTTDSSTSWLSRIGITRERVRPLLGKLGLEWWARGLVPARIQNSLPDSKGRVKKTGKASVVDWNRSRAVASGQGPIYVLAPEPDERRRIRDELADALVGLIDGKGRPVIKDAIPAEKAYEGPYVADGPDLILKQSPNVHVDGTIGASSVFGDPQTWRGENKDTGLFMVYGDGITAEAELDDMHILDIAPTVLHLHVQPVPESVDGEVRNEIFEPRTDPAEREVEIVEGLDHTAVGRGSASDREVKGRLEDLGYL